MHPLADGVTNTKLIMTFDLYIQPFPTYNNSAADDFENIVTKTLNNLHKR